MALHNVTVTTKEVAVEGLRVGDGLEAVTKRLGDHGKWQTTSSQAWWWLVYESKGLKFGFDRDPARPKFPKSLATPAVITRIGRFDKRVPYFYQYRRD